MAKQQIAEPETLGAAMNKTELFFENNGRKFSYIFLGLLILGGLIYGYRALVSQPRVEKAAALLAEAQGRLNSETPDFELALNGDAEGVGFLDVVEQYGSTPSGNLAKHYAGICYLRLGDLENAEKYLSMYKAVKELPGEIVNAQNLGLRGDIAVEKGEYEAAVALYKKAVAASANIYTAPLYLYKQVLAYAALGNKAEATKCLETLQADYASSTEAREAEKVVATL